MADFPLGANLYTNAFGSRPENVEVPVYATRAPTEADWNYPIGKNWIDQSGLASYVLLAVTSSAGINTATWENTGGGATSLDTLTGDSGGAISPTSGNINVLGTANQITTTGSGSTITWSVPSTFIAPGSAASTTGLTAGTTFTATGGASSFGGGTFTVASGTNAINISADAAATAVNVGTGAAAKTVIIGSSNTTSATTIAAGSGNVNMNSINVVQSKSSAAVAVTNQVTNSDNTSGTSNASYQVATGGASSGDPYIDFLVSGAGHYALGIDNSDSDNFKLAASGSLGTSDIVTITSAGAMTTAAGITATAGNIQATNGNLVLNTAGNKIVSTSVASTTTAGANSFGTVTLVGGTATISTTAVTASSIIMLTRQSVGATGAAALGNLSVGTITASTSFVINAWSAADATALQASDVSVIGWMIIN